MGLSSACVCKDEKLPICVGDSTMQHATVIPCFMIPRKRNVNIVGFSRQINRFKMISLISSVKLNFRFLRCESVRRLNSRFSEVTEF